MININQKNDKNEEYNYISANKSKKFENSLNSQNINIKKSFSLKRKPSNKAENNSSVNPVATRSVGVSQQINNYGRPESIISDISSAPTFRDPNQSVKKNDLSAEIRNLFKGVSNYSYQENPIEWARENYNLAEKLLERDQGGDLDNAVKYANFALKVFTKETHPEAWWNAKIVLGESLWGKSNQDLSGAENALNDAVNSIPAQIQSSQVARLNKSRGVVQLDVGGEKQNQGLAAEAETYFTQAIESFEAALKNENNGPLKADLSFNLGSAYSRLGEIKRDIGSFEKAVVAYNQNLQNQSKNSNPKGWAETNFNLGYINERIGIKRKNHSSFEASIAHYKNVQEFYNDIKDISNEAVIASVISDVFVKRADVFKNERYLADAAQFQQHAEKLSEASGNSENAKTAKQKKIDISQKHAEMVSIKDAWNSIVPDTDPSIRPIGNEDIQDNFNNSKLLAKDGKKILSKNTRVYQIYDNESRFIAADKPQEVARTRFNLGLNLWENGVETGNISAVQTAIMHYELALKYYTKDNDPAAWAQVQNNLGLAWKFISEKSDKLEDIITAVDHFKSAEKVWTKETNPQDWAKLQFNLALIYQRDGQKTRSLKSYQDALMSISNAKGVFDDKNDISLQNEAWFDIVDITDSIDRLRYEQSNDAHYAIQQHSVGNALLEIAKRKGDLALFDRAIQSFHAATDANDLRHDNSAAIEIIYDLGVALKDRAAITKADADYVEANQVLENARNMYAENGQEDKIIDVERHIQGLTNIISAISNKAQRLANAAEKSAFGLHGLQHAVKDWQVDLAIKDFQDAAELYNSETEPVDWANVQYNLAEAYSIKAEVSEQPSYYELAVQAYSSALNIYRKMGMYEHLSVTENQLNQALVQQENVLRAQPLPSVQAPFISSAHQDMTTEKIQEIKADNPGRHLEAELKFAEEQHKLGDKLKNHKENNSNYLKQAIEAYTNAYRIYDQKDIFQNKELVGLKLEVAKLNLEKMKHREIEQDSVKVEPQTDNTFSILVPSSSMQELPTPPAETIASSRSSNVESSSDASNDALNHRVSLDTINVSHANANSETSQSTILPAAKSIDELSDIEVLKINIGNADRKNWADNKVKEAKKLDKIAIKNTNEGNLIKSIHTWKQAFASYEANQHRYERAKVAAELAGTLTYLASLKKDINIRDEAINYKKYSIKNFDPQKEKKDWINSLNSLGEQLVERFSYSKNIADADQSVQAYVNSLKALDPKKDYKRFSQIQQRAGRVLFVKARHTKNKDDIDQAILKYEDSLKIYPRPLFVLGPAWSHWRAYFVMSKMHEFRAELTGSHQDRSVASMYWSMHAREEPPWNPLLIVRETD